MDTAHDRLARWAALIEAEYNEMPGLHLTRQQVQRLWGLDGPTTDALLRALENRQFLRRTDDDVYVRQTVY